MAAILSRPQCVKGGTSHTDPDWRVTPPGCHVSKEVLFGYIFVLLANKWEFLNTSPRSCYTSEYYCVCQNKSWTDRELNRILYMHIAPTEIVDISRLEQNDPRFFINSWKPSASVKQVIIGPDNGLSPGRRRAIIRTNAGLLSIGLLRTIFSEISMKIKSFSYKKISSKMSSANSIGHVLSPSMCE